MSDAVTTTHYRCTKCKSEDKDRGNNPPPPRLLVCWKCKAGHGLPEEQMFAQRVGMFPIATQQQQQS